ncbi:maleylpyruvate isomerase N-terminal domain-containing protein [Streptomyces sp. NPDC059477]|uniref:maleylpyruvate isomerase N-terminal domain-containing protein n=1 Tax=Streptomyces sp. NPDC059477 TaxID=3346847 RepID=UPI0036B3D36A
MRTLEQALTWVAEGTDLCRAALADLDETSYDAPSLLPGWTRKHVVAHLAGNASALLNLVRWARTGEITPMYSSPERRLIDIASGAELPGDRLTVRFEDSARALDRAMASLSAAQWRVEVVTAQQRIIPAGEVPWLRAREVMVHAVDLGTGIRFADLPGGFLAELRHDIRAKRGAGGVAAVRGDDAVPGNPVVQGADAVRGTDAEVTAYLAGRPYTGVTTAEGLPAEPLGPWL